MLEERVAPAAQARRPRILFTGHVFYPDEVRLRREAELLARCGYDVTVLALRRPTETATDRVNGVRVLRFPLAKKRGGKARYLFEFGASFLLNFVTVPYLCVREHFQVIQLYNQPDFLIFAIQLPRLIGAKVVFDYRDAMPETFISKYGWSQNHPIVRLLRFFEHWGFVASDRVITVHEPFKRRAIMRGAKPERTRVFLNVPDPNLFRPATAPAFPRRPNVSLQLMYHGTIAGRRGLDTALRAVGQLRERIPGIHLLIYGEGEGVPELRRLISEWELGDVVEYGGFIPLSDLPSYVAAADIGIIPVRRDAAEDWALSTKIFECMIFGKPVIASWRPILPEYIDDDAITYFEDGNADDLAERILEFYHQPEKAARQAENARRFLARYAWDQVTAEYRAMIEELAPLPVSEPV